jgi:hypothetical protein
MFNKYNSKNRKKIKGWLSEIDNRILEVILELQVNNEIVGSVAEIGLHHGKSFIPLCLSLQEKEKGYGIDLFEDQAKNIDQSGRGSTLYVNNNLADFGISPERYVLDSRSSELVEPSDIIDSVGKIRFFSIDGGHWSEIVMNDLNLAQQVMCHGGVIALDDYLRPEWPEVAVGFHRWYFENNKKFSVFAIGFNKVYLCSPDFLEFYRHALLTDNFLGNFLRKTYDLDGVGIPIYYTLFLPEWNPKVRAYGYIQLYHPHVFNYYKKFKNRTKPRTKF